MIWINHHALFRLIHRTTHLFMVLNGLLLMLITFVNYPTAVLAEHLQGPDPEDQRFAALLYSGTFILIAILYNVLWRYAAFKRRLLSKTADPALIDAITKQYRFGPLFYLAAFVLAFVSIPASVTVNAALAVYFAFTGQAKRPARPSDSDQISGESAS